MVCYVSVFFYSHESALRDDTDTEPDAATPLVSSTPGPDGLTEQQPADESTSAVDDDAVNTTTAVNTETQDAENVTDLPRSDGLNTVQVLDILRGAQVDSSSVLGCIPRGRKDNVYCVVSNTTNVNRKRRLVRGSPMLADAITRICWMIVVNPSTYSIKNPRVSTVANVKCQASVSMKS